MRYIWRKTNLSYIESKLVAKKLRLKEGDSNISTPLDYRVREPFHWAPETIGVLEGIIYTSAVIFNQLGLIAVWLAFKVLGEWNDSNESGPTRIRANNFVIGNGLSLVTGIVGGVLFWLFYNSSIVLKAIEDAYKTVR